MRSGLCRAVSGSADWLPVSRWGDGAPGQGAGLCCNSAYGVGDIGRRYCERAGIGTGSCVTGWGCAPNGWANAHRVRSGHQQDMEREP
jgi:hypothetical protein